MDFTFLLLYVYILVNLIFSEPLSHLFRTPLKANAKSKVEICNTMDLKQFTSMITESDGNVIIELPDKLILSKDFIEWFRGFTDAEGTFKIKANKGNSFTLTFSITLHIDDVEVLNYIHNNLGIGAVYLSKKYPRAS